MAIGGGGGGAGGGSAASANNSPGGGGAGAVTRALFNASHLPDTLYIQVGLGGQGGPPANDGSAGTRSFISIAPGTPSATNNIVGSGAAGAAGGQTLGTPGSGETAFVSTNGVFVTLSNFTSIVGQTGTLTGFAATNINPLTNSITCPGAGGGGMALSPSVFDGGSILSTTISSTISGGTAGSTGNGNDGANGIMSFKPFFSTGGAGGGNSIYTAGFGIGGNGGNGGIGSGGGGGGCSQNSTGGTGGRGGDGIVVIISF
jgi:hypothetical protein